MIFLDLNITSSVFWLLISFWKFLWYCLLFEVQAQKTSEKLLIISHHIKCKMIHRGLLVIFNLQSKLRGWVNDDFFINIFMRWNKKYTWDAIFHWAMMIIIYVSCCTLKYHVSLFFSRNLKSVIYSYFLSQFNEAVKELHKLWFPIMINTNIWS